MPALNFLMALGLDFGELGGNAWKESGVVCAWITLAENRPTTRGQTAYETFLFHSSGRSKFDYFSKKNTLFPM